MRASVGRCTAQAAGAWYDTRGAVAAHTCAEHRELAGDLLRAGMPRGRKLDRWLPASIGWSPVQHSAPPSKAYQLTITLQEVHPPIWRRVHVRADLTLTGLHDVMQVAMGWENYHLWRFGWLAFGDLRNEYDPDTALEAVLGKPGDHLGYLYDFGDCWVHHIELDKIVTQPRRGTVYPRCSAGKRACPPEDCGGPWGYEDTLKALRSRKGWRYQQARELCSTKFNPEDFDRDAVNTALAALSDR
ncbi:MAG: plasmid pRiA4b ORF-3 family protein [Pseudonocardiaceae bacterium]